MKSGSEFNRKLSVIRPFFLFVDLKEKKEGNW